MSALKLTRREALIGGGVLGAAAALGLATAGSPFAGGQQTVTFWHLFGGGDGARLAAILDEIDAEHADSDVRELILPWGNPYYTKLALAAVGGSPPDVAVMHATRIPAFAPAGLLEELTPERLAAHGDPVHLRDRLHAVPHRLRERDVVRVLPGRGGGHGDLAAAGRACRHADGDLVTAIGGLVEGPRDRGWMRLLIYAVVVALALVWIVPFAWAVATSIKPDAETTVAPVSWTATEQNLDAYRIAFEDGRILTWYFNSLLTATVITIGTIFTASLAAFAFSRMRRASSRRTRSSTAPRCGGSTG